MATLSVRSIAENCLGKSAPLSIQRDIFGVYGDDNPQTRSLKSQLGLIRNKPFVRVALVTITDVQGVSGTIIQGPPPNLQRDLDTASELYQRECDASVYCVGSITVDRWYLLDLYQDDCQGNGHDVSDEEDELFDLGRHMGANIVCYYIHGSSLGNRVAGCAAHPPGRRGFWVNQASPAYTQWTFVHELTHVVGDNRHVCDTDNLMLGRPCHTSGTGNITNLPPDLTNDQRNRILDDPDIETCG